MNEILNAKISVFNLRKTKEEFYLNKKSSKINFGLNVISIQIEEKSFEYKNC